MVKWLAKYWLLLAIFLIAFLVRFLNIANFPPALNWDEISHGYSSYSILKSGADEWGQSFPLANFRAYGDYPTTLYLYLVMPFIWLGGLNELTVRLPSVIFGAGLTVAVYLLGQQLFKSRKISLLAASLVILVPWGILTSRQVLQATPAATLFVLGIAFFLKRPTTKLIYQLIGTLLLGLSAYSYHNTRILAPLIFGGLLIYQWPIIKQYRRGLITVVLLAVVLLGPIIPILISSQGSARANWVAILDQGAINQINEQRGTSQLPSPLDRLVHNKVSYFLAISTQNYIGYFSPQFLAIDGGTHYQFSIPGWGLMSPIDAIGFYLGLVYLLIILNPFTHSRIPKKLISRRGALWLMLGLLLAPLPAAITRDPYQVVRGQLMLPFIILTAALGLYWAWSWLRAKVNNLAFVGLGLVLGVYLFFSISYLYQLFIIYPKTYSFAWQYGYKQAINYVVTHQDKYTEVYFSKKYGEPHEYLLFFTSYNPLTYRNDPNLIRYQKSNWFWVDRFDKYHFINDWEFIEKTSATTNSLLITSPNNYPTSARFLERINFLDGQPAFDIVEMP